MRKIMSAGLIMGLLSLSLYAYGYVRVGNVRESWRTWEGKIDTMKVNIVEQNLMCRVWQEMTIRDPLPDSSAKGDSLEIQVYLRLPENSAVDSLHLWIDGKPVPGLLMSASSATAIYESIVKRRKDPAILTTYGGNDYYLRIFPVMPGQSRKVRIGYHCPMNSRSASKNIRLPMDYADTVGRFNITVQTSQTRQGANVDEPKLTLGPCYLNGPDCIVKAYANNLAFPQNYLQVSWGPWPLDNNISSCYSTDKNGMGYFSLLLDPFSLLGMKNRANISLSIAWTPSMIETWYRNTSYTSTYSEYFEGERRALRDFISNNLQQNDKFTLCYAGPTLMSFSKDLVPATTTNKQAASAFIDACQPIYYDYSYTYYYDAAGVYHYKPNPPPPGRNWLGALYHAFESFQSTDLQPVVLVLDKGNPYWYSETRPTVNALDSTTATICLKNKHGALMYVITSYSRLALYKKLINRFGGRVVQSWSGDDMDARLSDLTPDIFSVPLTSLTIQVASSNGSPCLDVLGIPQSRIPWNSRILLSGRTVLTDMLAVTLAGESNGAYVSASKSVQVTATPDASPEKIWAINKVNSASYYYYYGYYGNDADEMVAFSLKHNVLTRYTALLALEPGMDTAFSGSEQSSNSWGITATRGLDNVAAFSEATGSFSSGETDFPDINKVENATIPGKALLLSVTPNPFSVLTQISINPGENAVGQVVMAIYDINGKKIYAFKTRKNQAGQFTVAWNGCNAQGKRMPQGVYLLKVEMGSKVLTQKIVLM